MGREVNMGVRAFLVWWGQALWGQKTPVFLKCRDWGRRGKTESFKANFLVLWFACGCSSCLHLCTDKAACKSSTACALTIYPHLHENHGPFCNTPGILQQFKMYLCIFYLPFSKHNLPQLYQTHLNHERTDDLKSHLPLLRFHLEDSSWFFIFLDWPRDIPLSG